jgi:maleate cis-trans isomerase
VIGCTSLSVACTEPAISKLTAMGRPLPVITAFSAILARLEKVRASRILLLAPYDSQTLEKEANLLEACGYTVVKRVQLGYEKEIRFIETDYLCEEFMQHYSTGLDCAVFSCTGLYTVEAINRLTILLDNHCVLISSNTAIAAMLNDMDGLAN